MQSKTKILEEENRILQRELGRMCMELQRLEEVEYRFNKIRELVSRHLEGGD